MPQRFFVRRGLAYTEPEGELVSGFNVETLSNARFSAALSALKTEQGALFVLCPLYLHRVPVAIAL